MRYAAEHRARVGLGSRPAARRADADDGMAAWWARRAHAAASPGAARDLILMNSEIDVRHVLPTVQAPSLVLHRTGDNDSRCEEGRWIAGQIPGARFVELPGDDHVPWIDPEQILDEVEEFLTGDATGSRARPRARDVLFTDIVGSTERAASLGDRRWRELVESTTRSCAGSSNASAGTRSTPQATASSRRSTGRRARFARACAIRDGVRQLGLEIRAGVHTGECEVAGDAVRGIAVHAAARVAARADAGRVLVVFDGARPRRWLRARVR